MFSNHHEVYDATGTAQCMEAPTQSPMPSNLGQQCGKMGLEAGLGGDMYMDIFKYIYICIIFL